MGKSEEKITGFLKWTYTKWSFWILVVLAFIYSDSLIRLVYGDFLYAFGYLFGQVIGLTVIYLIAYALIKHFRKNKNG